MSPGAGQLLELQSVDDRLAALRGEALDLEARLSGDPELDRTREEAEAAREAQERADAAVRALDREVEDMRHRASVIERQLYGGSVRNPQELMTLQRELNEVLARVAAVEEDELQRMAEAEEAAGGARTARDAVSTIEARRAASAGPDRQRLDEVRTAIGRTETERAEVAARLSDRERALYDRVASRRAPAVVRLVEGSCGGCRLPVAINEARHVRTGPGIVQCSNCDRILAP